MLNHFLHLVTDFGQRLPLVLIAVYTGVSEWSPNARGPLKRSILEHTGGAVP